MTIKYISVLALAAALFVGEPAFAKDNHKGGQSHAVAAVHKAGGHSRAIASVHRTNHSVAAVHRTGGGGRVAAASGNRSRGTRSGGTFATTRNVTRSRPSMAFGGTANNSGANASNRGGRGNYTYAFDSHSGWSPGHEYYWHGRHYRWYDNAWYIFEPFSNYTYGSNYSGGSVATQVQADLARDGYYQGPVDGIVGPGTRGAIAAYQRDNGLPVTGTINGALLDSLGVG